MELKSEIPNYIKIQSLKKEWFKSKPMRIEYVYIYNTHYYTIDTQNNGIYYIWRRKLAIKYKEKIRRYMDKT